MSDQPTADSDEPAPKPGPGDDWENQPPTPLPDYHMDEGRDSGRRSEEP